MLLRSSLSPIAALLTLVAFSGAVRAQDPASGGSETRNPIADAVEPGHGSVKYRLGFFDAEDSGDGNPFLDESLTVIEPVIVFDRQITEKTGITATLSYDYVSSASIDRLSGFSEQSGASGDNYVGVDLGVRYLYSKRVNLSGHVGFSTEYDYQSIGLGGAVAVDSEDGDYRLTYSLDAFFDSLDVIRGTTASMGAEDGNDSRTSFSGTVKWYQVLSPESHGELGVTLGHQTGFLETPYNFVVDENNPVAPFIPFENGALGEDVVEILPDSRTRVALFGRWRKRLKPGRAVELGGRLYYDDWGITSYAFEPQLHQRLSESWLMRLRYRFYDQTAADAFYDRYLGEPGDRTQDSDLGDFSSNLFGVEFTLLKSESNVLDFGLDYVLRSDGLDQIIASFGWDHYY